MFPIPWNFPFRKKNGDVTTIGEMIGGGGGGSDIPEHTAADAGKVLAVDDNGGLTWATISGGSNFGKGSLKNITLNPAINASEGV